MGPSVNVFVISQASPLSCMLFISHSWFLDFSKTEFLSFAFLSLGWNFERGFWACLKRRSCPHIHSGQKTLAGPQKPENGGQSGYKPLDDPLFFSMQMGIKC